MTSLKLWYWPGACSLAAHIVLNELALPYDTAVYDPSKAEELKKVNLKMKVPVLEIDNEPITENVAILTAIADLAPERNALGSTKLERLSAYEYMSYLSGTLHGQGFGGLFRPGRYSDDTSVHKGIQDKSMQTVLDCYEYIENGLKGVHAIGEHFTVIDPYLYVFYRWGASRIPDMQTRYPKYAALVSELLKLDSAKQALKDEGIESYAPVDGLKL